MTEHADLVGFSDYVWGRCRERLAGLTDDEYLWEPVSGAVKVGDDPGGDRFTSLAWRMQHIADLLDEERNAVWLRLPSRPAPDATPATARDALARLDAAYATWRDVLAHTTDLDEPLGDVAGPYGTATRRSFVYHILDELIHHAAETALLRDLYRAGFTRSSD